MKNTKLKAGEKVDTCSFCKKIVFEKDVVLSKNGKVICANCVTNINSLIGNREMKFVCNHCQTPLLDMVESIVLDHIDLNWEQEKDGSLTLIGMETYGVTHREYLCGNCDNKLDVDTEALLDKEMGYAINSDLNILKHIKDCVESILEKKRIKREDLKALKEALDEYEIG